MASPIYPFPHAELRQFHSKSTRVDNAALALLFCKRAGANTNRWLISISKKTEPLATRRNRSRRLLVEAIRQLQPYIEEPIDAVVIIKKSLHNLKEQTAQSLLKQLLLQQDLHSYL